ncbi:uncharacterized protein LOC109837516 [Asparagus officinalis]|uniref:uncharacterized protein LOC109837516 n=1 Tax=Asparagus officinalis TaxID=4686 RepID=UPI00098E405A|nr:uncharacterized protein LOC109837516 [Asparagus officinalis]
MFRATTRGLHRCWLIPCRCICNKRKIKTMVQRGMEGLISNKRSEISLEMKNQHAFTLGLHMGNPLVQIYMVREDFIQVGHLEQDAVQVYTGGSFRKRCCPSLYRWII